MERPFGSPRARRLATAPTDRLWLRKLALNQQPIDSWVSARLHQVAGRLLASSVVRTHGATGLSRARSVPGSGRNLETQAYNGLHSAMFRSSWVHASKEQPGTAARLNVTSHSGRFCPGSFPLRRPCRRTLLPRSTNVNTRALLGGNCDLRQYESKVNLIVNLAHR